MLLSTYEKTSPKDQAHEGDEAVCKDNPQFLVTAKPEGADRTIGKKELEWRESEVVRMRREGKNNDEIFRRTGYQFFGDGRAAFVLTPSQRRRLWRKKRAADLANGKKGLWLLKALGRFLAGDWEEGKNLGISAPL